MAVIDVASTLPVTQDAARTMQPATIPESIYIRYLPTIMQQDHFLRRFLMIFESVLKPLEELIDTLPLYTEPEMTPEDYLPWLAQWTALSLDSSWPIERRRALIAHAVEIYRWRGTAYGLKLHILCYTGIEPLIQESRGGFVLGGDNRLGWTTILQTAPANPLLAVITVPVSDPRQVDVQILRQIIEESKPAFITYRLRVVRARTIPPAPARPRNGP